MQRLIILILIVGIRSSQFFSTKRCDCDQMLTENDCSTQSEVCVWDQIKKKCKDKNNEITGVKPTFCSFTNQIDCLNLISTKGVCQWVDKKCTHFTGCEAFDEITDKDCQDISKKCITNGSYCIELDSCENYQIKSSCLKSIKGNYCYWNDEFKTCSDVNQCSQLPKSLTSDNQCRTQIKTCTVKSGGGCEDSGDSCSDQKLEIQCQYDKNLAQQCVWQDNSCQQKTCENAPTNYTLESQCTSFLSSCTLKEQGGCRTRTLCQEVINEVACTVDYNNNPCYWDGLVCFLKKCENATKQFTTDEQCKQLSSNCTLKQSGGCKIFQYCNEIEVKSVCTKDLSGNNCVFDQSCRAEDCEDAPTSYTTKEQCQLFYPTSLCLNKANGGCYKVQSCLDIQTQQDCIVDGKGTSCFWSETQKCQSIDPDTCGSFIQKQQCIQYPQQNCMWQEGCQLKECVFASKTIKTFQGCQGYKETCTLSANGEGCIEIPLICEANLSEKSCIVRGNYIDGIFKTFNCSWSKIGCKDYNIKTCDMVEDTITKNYDCQSFSEFCILSNTGLGCMENPENCSDKKLETNCITIFSQQIYECRWDTEKQLCYEYDCTQASKKINSFTYTTCNEFLYHCIPNNDLTNCITKPESCSGLSVKNCEDSRWPTISSKCYMQGNQCVEAKCENVLVNSSGKCYQNFVQETCVINNEKTGCSQLLKNCSDYKIIENCDITYNNSYCKWNSTSNICETNCDKARDYHITYEQCQNYGQYCQPLQRTASLGCTNLMENCNEYTIQAQCHKIRSQNSKEYDVCEWNDTYKECRKVDPKFIVDVIKDESDCQVRFTPLYTIKYGQFLSCQTRYLRCEYYQSQDSCTLADEGPCIYDKTCKLLTVDLDCQNFKGSYKICEAFNPKCKGSLNQSQQQCISKECSDYYSKGLWSECQKYLSCSVSNDLYCTIKLDSCGQYKSLKDCVQTSESSFCQWKDDSCLSWDNQCETIKITTTPDICSYYSDNCTHNSAKTSCQQKKDNCSEYLIDSCSKSKEGVCIWKLSTNQCIHPLSDQDCQFKQGINLSVQDCSLIDSNCYPNRSKASCQLLKTNCSQYTNLQECTSTQIKYKCIQTKAQNSGASCTEYLDGQDCDTVFLGENTTTAEACRELGCSWKDSSSCAKKSCENTPQELITQNQCNIWIKECVLNSIKTACITQKDKCTEYLNESDCSVAKEGGCMFKKSKCILKACYLADPSIYSTHNNCQLYSPMCTITKPGGCEQMGPCSTELLETSCKQNLKYNCHWNVIDETCVNNVCTELEQNSSFDTSQECRSKGCILNVNGLGCQDRGECQDYNESQCKDGSMNKNNQECDWNKNLQTPVCEVKSCSTASVSIKSHSECQTYLNGCTVQAKLMDDGSYQAGGCTAIQNCANYMIEDQCKQDQANNICGWNGQKCDNKSCLTAPQTTFYSTHEECQNYLENCTVNSNLQGCIEIPNTCEEITIEEQCYIQRSGDKCIWLESDGCKLRTCDIATSENLPSLQFNNNDNCKNFLPTCSFSSAECIYKVCEYYRYTSHEQCSNAMSGCTTDGVKCVQKHISCDNALSASGCTTNKKGEACQWVEWYNPPHCVLKKCDTAPLSLKTEIECQNYYSKYCTAKLNGGCQLKKQCQDAKIQEACTTNLQGEKCYWDNSQCRDQQCSDLYGAIHQECYEQLEGCTVSENGKCTQMKYCQEMKFQIQCIVGLDGPCLWISQYTNEDLSKGACFQYSSCKSLAWDSVEKCRMISPYCTTDGNQCQSITKCENSRGICNIGTDGDCIKVLVNQNLVCKKLESCTEAKYYTYEECQMASKKCTVDPDLGCIDLQVCQNYQKEKSCMINAVGPILTVDSILSTGLCVWDSQTKKCRDKSCEDFTFTNHEQCQAMLDKCTSDGKKCIEQLNCSEYETNEQCSSIKGLEGKCFWEEDQCHAITSCESASKNQQACLIVKDRCNWIPATEKAGSTCDIHSCETYFKTNGSCQKFFNFNFSQQKFCDKNQKGECIEIDPVSYSKDKCLTNTNFTFMWNSTCQVCQKQIEIPAQIPIVDPIYQNPIEIVNFSQLIFQGFIILSLQNI